MFETFQRLDTLRWENNLSSLGEIHSSRELISRFDLFRGSDSGSVGRAVASDTRGLWFESSHQQNLYFTFICLFTIGCVEKTKINKKSLGMAHFLKNI